MMLKNELKIILYENKSGFNTLISTIKMVWQIKLLLKYFLIQKQIWNVVPKMWL